MIRTLFRATALSAVFVVMGLAVGILPAARANLIAMPPHSHAPSPVVTWSDGHAPTATHQHQHRTDHDPRAGVKVHSAAAGAQAYVANNPGQVWVGRDLVVVGGAHPFSTEFGHGHQGHELDGARYDIHTNAAGGRDPAAFNMNATARVFDAFNGIGGNPGWLDIGNASGPKNWPGTDNDEAAGTGVAWHSSIDWRAIAFDPAQPAGSHELHVVYGATADGALGATTGFTPGHNTPGLLTITMSNSVDWYYGVSTDPTVAPHSYDFASVILHEVGHVIGLDHFGSYAAGQIMNEEPNPLRDDHVHLAAARRAYVPFGGTVTLPDGTMCDPTVCVPGMTTANPLPAGSTINYPAGSGTLHTIDPDAIHGVRDLYAIAVPEPTGLTLLATSALGMLAFGRRRLERWAAGAKQEADTAPPGGSGRPRHPGV
ncbi:MAG: hypothetical protein K2X87_27985 [Gemmataceae bacterium]|nr:hypothetical protein [Gemmataceae bacterium]